MKAAVMRAIGEPLRIEQVQESLLRIEPRGDEGPGLEALAIGEFYACRPALPDKDCSWLDARPHLAAMLVNIVDQRLGQSG